MTKPLPLGGVMEKSAAKAADTCNTKGAHRVAVIIFLNMTLVLRGWFMAVKFPVEVVIF
jgi:hypothetical protein